MLAAELWRWAAVATTTSREPQRSLLSKSAEETEQAGRRLGRHMVRGDVLLLVGGMGVGKTTFVRGLARGMGIRDDVMSPTFQLVRIYGGPTPLAHVDLYRLDDAGEIEDLGLEELLDEGAVVVEWGDRLSRKDAPRLIFEERGPERRWLCLVEAPAAWSL
jgi:tRNA threonylcarbamoyl adenosine modification protein YjeE